MDWNRLDMGWTQGSLGPVKTWTSSDSPNAVAVIPTIPVGKTSSKLHSELPSHLHFDLHFSCQNGDFIVLLCAGSMVSLMSWSWDHPRYIPIIRQESGPSATHHLFSAPAQSWQRWWTPWLSPGSGGPVILTSTWDSYRIGDAWRWRLDGAYTEALVVSCSASTMINEKFDFLQVNKPPRLVSIGADSHMLGPTMEVKTIMFAQAFGE